MGGGRHGPTSGVLHVITSTQRRGAELVAWTVAPRLAGTHRLVALSAAATAPVLDVPALGPSALHPTTLRNLRRRAARAAVVVAHGSRTLPAAALALAGTRRPLVYVNIGDPRYWAGSGARKARMRLLYRRADRVAVLGDTAGDVLVADYGVQPSAVRVVGQGRDLADFPVVDPAARAAARRRWQLDPDVPVVAFLGALSSEKRVDVLIDAVALLPPPTILLLAGDGPLRPTLEERAGRALGSRARFVGTVADPVGLLAAADVLALTSDTEGLPGVCIEAGLLGLPVVATDVGFVADIVEPGVSGYLVGPGDPAGTAAALLDALAQRDRLGAAGRHRCAADYSLDTVVRRWDGLLAELVNR